MRRTSGSIGKGVVQRAMMETMETRRLLSGNVTVTDDGATIHVNGDNKSNQIEINGDGGFAYVVNGLNGTKVNGAASATFPVATTRNLDASLGNGEDEITLDGAVLFRAAGIDTGNGNDTVVLNDAGMLADLSISTGNGGDDVSITDLLAFSNLNVDLGNGPDSLSFGGANTVLGNSTLVGGHGPNTLTNLASLLTTGTQTVADF